MSNSFQTRSISAEGAAKLINATLVAAKRIGFEPSIAVTDATGMLKAFHRTDGSPSMSVDIAINKAWTATGMKFSTDQWVDILEDPGAKSLQHMPRLTAVPGGYPIFEADEMIGALGISGGTWQQDAEAGKAALATYLK